MARDREGAIRAFHLLNGFVGDLAAGSQVRRIFMSPQFASQLSSTTAGCVSRMCLSHLVMTLDKWSEFYDRFHHIIPDDCREACRKLRRDVNRRKIERFRNTVVSHVWDKKRKRTLTRAEVEAAFQAVVGGDPDAFAEWCNHPTSNPFPVTVVGIVEYTRDRIRQEYQLSEQELFGGEHAA